MAPSIPPAPAPNPAPLVLPLQAVGIGDIAEVGGKNASLGELIQQLALDGVQVPGGFATTAAAYRQFIAAGDLQRQLHSILDGLDGHDIGQLQAAGAAARALLLGSPLPQPLQQAILQAYRELGAPAVAVRSSPTGRCSRSPARSCGRPSRHPWPTRPTAAGRRQTKRSPPGPPEGPGAP